MRALLCLLLAMSALDAQAQTQVDLKTQSKGIDFSGASLTRPARTGTQLPTTCAIGELFFNTAAQPGTNVYGCTATNTWSAQSGLVSVPNYGRPFTTLTTLVILGTEHLLNTPNILVSCYDNGSPARVIEPDSVTVNGTTYDVTIQFVQAQSGRCVLNGNGINGVSAGGAVASVFGRTGGVAAQAGDYSFAQISGTVANSQLAAGVDATKIGLGTVTNTVLDYLSDLRSDAQVQLDGKAAVVHSHTTAGDVTGDLASLNVGALQGRPVGSAAPTDQQALLWSQSAGAWVPQNLPVSGAQMTWQLLDLNVTRDSTGTVLTIGGSCSSATPCHVRFGNASYSVITPAQATVGAGSTGIAFVYVMPGGQLAVGHNISVTCSGCVATSGVTSFPPTSLPLYSWTASNGLWDLNGGTDLRAMLSTTSVSAGTGIALANSGSAITMSVDSSVVPSYLSASSALNFGSLSSGSCSGEMTFTLNGALAGDAVAPGWPSTLPAGVIGMMRIPASGTAGVQLCNWSGSAVTVNATFRATVVRSF